MPLEADGLRLLQTNLPPLGVRREAFVTQWLSTQAFFGKEDRIGLTLRVGISLSFVLACWGLGELKTRG